MSLIEEESISKTLVTFLQVHESRPDMINFHKLDNTLKHIQTYPFFQYFGTKKRDEEYTIESMRKRVDSLTRKKKRGKRSSLRQMGTMKEKERKINVPQPPIVQKIHSNNDKVRLTKN